MTDIKYDFFDQSFDVTAANNIKGTPPSYAEFQYPGENNKPVLRYNEMQFYPSRIIIGNMGAQTYVMVIETINKVNGTDTKLFIKMTISTSSLASQPEGPLTQLFNAINTPAKATVNLNSLFGAAVISGVTHKINKSSTSSSFTLHIKDPVTVNLNNTTLTSLADLAAILPTMSTSATDNSPQSISLIHSPLTQRQRCTRSTDNASKTVPVVTATTSSVQTNILVLVILGLCIAAFFPTIYYGLVCFPAGDKSRAAIHLIYLVGALSMVMPLFVRGFKDGDPAAQVWGVGIIVLVLIFGWQYYDLSSKMILKCGADVPVTNVNISGHFGNISKNYLFFILFVLCLLPLFISAMVKSADDSLFGGLVGGQAIITAIAVCLFRIYGNN